MIKNVVTRFAPSPTGVLHVGSARTALFNYLYAKKYNGKCILRIEDTDKERSKKEFEDDIKQSLTWLGISFGAEYRQSDRGEIYEKYLLKMLENGSAYEAEENKDGTGNVIRFKNPNKEVTFNDVIRGDVAFNTTELEDFIIAKNIQSPLYHLGVVVDDYEMNVTHVIRGEDGISNTPRQILIQKAIGAPLPIYAHIPLILAEDRSKLSKRHGAKSIGEYRNMGYLKEAIINFIALIGWNPGGNKEIFTLEELVNEFDLKKIQKGGAIFNIEKLNWTNKEYIKKMSDLEVKDKIIEYLPTDIKNSESFNEEILQKIAPIIAERINVFSDINEIGGSGDIDYYFKKPNYKSEMIAWKGTALTDTKKHLHNIVELLDKIEFIDSDTVKNTLWEYASSNGRGEVLWPMRYALSGKEKSPDPFTLAYVLGKKETIDRIKNAIEYL